ncbi:hypothetical protein [Microvirga lotononidis]|uniref:Uncharacterized protein n=1 Tax=Microvirga lotononidis TaxID=864069 RepID=I4YP34_9HYPH|nr:hypothetical protein [Microvirga lotononidis]EIM25726.1 hypothetical protein MicloDRAFT_00064530 [Microvirga lotononidis]WQO25660.1 hypothetical protein U0023_13130 [Microvirga lotononidis]
MSNRYDLLTSKTDKDGKKRWTKVGVMFPSKQGEGFSIKLEALPLPNAEGEVWISAFVPRENDGQGRPAPQQGGGRGFDSDDSIPF